MPRSPDLVREDLAGHPDSLILVHRSWEAQWLDAYFCFKEPKGQEMVKWKEGTCIQLGGFGGQGMHEFFPWSRHDLCVGVL